MLTITIITNDVNKFFGKSHWRGKAYLLKANKNGMVRYFVASGIDTSEEMKRLHQEAYERSGEEMYLDLMRSNIGDDIFCWEVLIFPSDKKGNMTNQGGTCGGGKKMTYREAIEDLRRNIRIYGLKEVWNGDIELD